MRQGLPNSVAPPASSERPLPLVARKDLQVREAEYGGQRSWIVKDPVRLEYFRLSRKQHAILELLDGERSIEAIHAGFQRAFPFRRLTLLQIRQLAFELYEKGLVWSTRPGQAETLLDRDLQRKRQRRRSVLRNLFFIRFPGWDPQRLLDCIYPATRWIFHPWIVIGALLLFAGAWGFLLVHFADAHDRAPELNQLATWHAMISIWVVLGGAKVLHELGHALACRHFGGECHEIGLAFLIFSPCLYCDVSDSWVLASKWKRIAIAAAGMYVEAVLSVAALLLWWNTTPGILHDLSFVLLLITGISTILFNLNPLLRLDGYYILSDWLEIPNLRQRADRMLESKLTQWCLGVRPASNTAEDSSGAASRTAWFVLYSIGSLAYRWFVCFAICFILYRLLRPVGLEHLGLLLGIASAALAIAMTIRKVACIVIGSWDQMTSFVRPAVTIAALAGVVFTSLVVPLPVRVMASLAVQPHNIQHVYISTPGRIKAVLVRPGQRVQQGDVLVRMANFRREDYLRQLRIAMAVQEVELSVHQALGDANQHALAVESMRAIREEAGEYEAQLAKLTVVAPCDGVVIAPQERHRHPSQRRDWEMLPTWSGSPLDLQNCDCFLDAGTHLLSVAPEDRHEAILRIDEPDRHDFTVGQDVRIEVDHLPGVAVRSRIERLAQYVRGESGPLLDAASPDTETPKRGGQAAKRVHEAVVLLPRDRPDLIPGARGRASILVTHRSAAGWLWRYVSATFKFLE